MSLQDTRLENSAVTNVPIVRRDDAIASFGAFTSFEPKSSERIVLAKSPPRSGLTHFLRYLDHQLLGEFQLLYVSGADKTLNSFFNQVFTQLLCDEDHKTQFTAFIARQKGSGQISNVLRTLAVCIPIIGPAFGVAEHAGEKHLSGFNNDIHILNIGAEYLAEASMKRPIIICLDVEGENSAKVIEFASRFSSDIFSQIKFIIGLKEKQNGNESDRIIVGLENADYDIREINFPLPSSSFVVSLYSSHGLTISASEAQNIANRDSRDIYRIVRGAHTLKKSQSVGELAFASLSHSPSPIEKKIIGFLAVAEQALPESELVELILTSEDLYVEDAQALRPTIDKLEQLQILNVFDLGHDRSIILNDQDNKVLVASEPSRVDYFLISQQLFKYFERRFQPDTGISSLRYAALLYRLAAVCDQDRRSEFGRGVLRYSILMQNFSELEPKLSNSLVRDKTADFEDFVLSVLYRVATKDYSGALQALSSSSATQWRDRHPCLMLEAICNNRLRSHERADGLLDLAARSASTLDELVVLHGYRISNYLHWGRVEEARSHYSETKQACCLAENFGYLMRNAAAAFERTTKYDMEMEAATFFEGRNHHYGQFSSMVNAGATQMALDHYDRAGSLFEQARPELEKYGIQNSVIVTFNAMANATFSGDLDTASRLLDRFKRQPDHNVAMTEMYTVFYESLLAFREGRVEKASSGIRSLQSLLDSTHMPRAKERLYANNLTLGMALGFPDEEIHAMIEVTKNWIDKRDPITTERVLGHSETWIGSGTLCNEEEVLHLLCPPYFAYWYMDEISLLSRAWFASN